MTRTLYGKEKKTKVVHVLHDKYDFYLGRENKSYGLSGSPFANPFRIGKCGSRGEVIEKYEIYLRDRLAKDRKLKKMLKKMKNKRLACWCRKEHQTSPKCHVDAVIKVMDELFP